MVDERYQYSDLTGRIIRCAMNVHSTLKNGFPEVIYQKALAIEMAEYRISFAREFEMPIYYKTQEVGRRKVDFLVEDCIVVELKARTQLEDAHLTQALNYLEAYNLEIGLLINFGSESLKVRRLINKKFDPKIQRKFRL